jgi:hypothetical protein
MYIPHPSLFFGEPPTEMKRTQMICHFDRREKSLERKP